MIWGKQFYWFDVQRWLDGDPTQPPPPEGRRWGRNSQWTHFEARDIMSMPDPWEYPWFAAWDLAFHTVALAHLDPAFAKYQLLVLCREWFQHPNGALPAYEWAFGDVNPPVHAWAALHVWDIDGQRDRDFLARLLPKLLINFTWWVNRVDPDGDHLFSGGFLGLDNISAVDRSNLPDGETIEQADGTAWMAFYTLTLLQLTRILAATDDAWTDIEVKFIEHFMLIVEAMQSEDLWDDDDGFFYDVHRTADGISTPVPVRSIVGVLPILGTVVLRPGTLERIRTLGKRAERFLEDVGAVDDGDAVRGRFITGVDGDSLLVSVVPPGNGVRILQRRVRRGRVPVAVRTAGVVTSPRRAPGVDPTRQHPQHRRLRARRVEQWHVRWELELAGPGVDAGQLPDPAQPAAVRHRARPRGDARVPEWQRDDAPDDRVC